MKEAENKLPIFRKNFHELRGKMSQAEFADFLGISRPTVGFYENGDRIPDSAVFKQICEKCKCSSDWLLGISGTKSPDITVQTICKYTGLDENPVNVLKSLHDNRQLGFNDAMIQTVNILLKERNTLEAISQFLFCKVVEEVVSFHVEFKTADVIPPTSCGLTTESFQRMTMVKIQERLMKLSEKMKNGKVAPTNNLSIFTDKLLKPSGKKGAVSNGNDPKKGE